MLKATKPEIDELYRSESLLVKRVGGYRSKSCVVTFDSFTDYFTLDRPGYAETFLMHRSLDAVHVISRYNQWYQYPEIEQAMAAVHEATRAYQRVVTYGSSMGAYAAIRLAGLAGADCALAMSPQYSIDPRVAPFENRWKEASLNFRPVWEGKLPLPALREAYIVFDPANLDAKHVNMFRRTFQFTPVKLRGAGHPVVGFLHEVHLLERFIMRVFLQKDGAPVDEIVRDARSRRRQSAQFMLHHAERAWRRSLKIARLEEAVRLAPANAGVRWQLAKGLASAGRFKDAVATFEAALQIAPEHPAILLNFSRTLERQGDIAGAITLAGRALAQSGNAPPYSTRLENLQKKLETAPQTGFGKLLDRIIRRP
jgi:tetratricopeptide (TPR) repeat protein